MKKIIFLILNVIICYSIKAQSSTAHEIADKMAMKLKDSLQLTQAQKSQLYAINRNTIRNIAAVRKQVIRQDSVKIKIEAIDSKRDSLYKMVLRSKFPLYIQNKKKFIED